MTRALRTAGVFVAAVSVITQTGAARSAASGEGQTIAVSGLASGVPACGGCHGAKGEGQPAIGAPRLAGLGAAYLDHQIEAFATGTRDNAIMSPIAKLLDADTRREVAAYYAELNLPPAHRLPALAGAGAALALHGDWAAKMPPCASCHGIDGLGVGAAFPPLAGQSAAYLAAELEDWKTGTRHDDPLALMKTVAGRLTDDQIASVSAYYSALPAAATPPAQGCTP